MGLVAGMALIGALALLCMAWKFFQEAQTQRKIHRRKNLAAWYYILTWLCAGGAIMSILLLYNLFAWF
ncbi:MAG: hypothetical protein HFF90_05555 [Oscillibacter sp.]|nr:hypothetical protein [Oscillibacter sp.]